MAGHGKPWQGQPWQALPGHGRPWQGMSCRGGPWPSMACCRQPCLVTASHGRRPFPSRACMCRTMERLESMPCYAVPCRAVPHAAVLCQACHACCAWRAVPCMSCLTQPCKPCHLVAEKTENLLPESNLQKCKTSKMFAEIVTVRDGHVSPRPFCTGFRCESNRDDGISPNPFFEKYIAVIVCQFGGLNLCLDDIDQGCT